MFVYHFAYEMDIQGRKSSLFHKDMTKAARIFSWNIRLYFQAHNDFISPPLIMSHKGGSPTFVDLRMWYEPFQFLRKPLTAWTITKGVNSNSPALNLALGVGRENSCKVMQKLFFILRAVPNPPKTSFFHRRTVPPFLLPPLYTT